jgi:hypothetical protein
MACLKTDFEVKAMATGGFYKINRRRLGIIRTPAGEQISHRAEGVQIDFNA